MKVLVTGDRGFICGHIIEKLLFEGSEVWGLDNDWKYGPLEKGYDNHPKYHHIHGDAKDEKLITSILFDNEIEVFVMGAAIIGGISMFHQLAFDLVAENDRISAASFQAAIDAHNNSKLDHVIAISSSMVYESTNFWPSKEGDQYVIPPPLSTYGHQKLNVEYYCKGANIQYKLPYKIAIPFNCVGLSEYKARIESLYTSGGKALNLSHAIPDLIKKVAVGMNPLPILGEGNQIRHYTYAQDLAEGFYKLIMCEEAMGDTFNLSTPHGHSVLEVAEKIWKKMNSIIPFQYVTEKAFQYDVQKRIPDVTKAEMILGFTAKTSLDDILDAIIPWYVEALNKGLL